MIVSGLTRIFRLILVNGFFVGPGITTALVGRSSVHESSKRTNCFLPFGKIVRTVSPLSRTAVGNSFAAACIPFGW